MNDLVVAGAAVAAYMAVLVAAALWAERAEGQGRRVAHNPLVYSLSLAVYATTWTFYGSVGFAARNGLLFLSVYLGPTLVFAAAWWLLRPLIRLKDARRLTGLPDLLSLRYEKSRAVALLATVVLVVGLILHVALQLKTMIATLALVTSRRRRAHLPRRRRRIGPPLVVLLLLFTIAVGLRRVRPERHPASCSPRHRVGGEARRVPRRRRVRGVGPSTGRRTSSASRPSPPGASLLGGEAQHLALPPPLAAVAVILLPRQFTTVVENADVSHLRTAMWLFPAYLLAINVFVLPLALAALALGGSAEAADTFVLALPLDAREMALSWAVFLGGFSAGLGMVVAETTALATMISNDIVVPAAETWAPVRPLRRHLVPTRWAAAALVLAAAGAYERAFGASSPLVSIGFVSFAAVMQLAPALVGGLCWSGASRTGAIAGMSAGFATWAYTVVVPVLARSGWLPVSLLREGPFGIEALVPEGLFDLHVDPVSHTVIWSLIANVGAFFIGSALRPPPVAELDRGRGLVQALDGPTTELPPGGSGLALAPAQEKRTRRRDLLASYFGTSARRLAEECLRRRVHGRSGPLGDPGRRAGGPGGGGALRRHRQRGRARRGAPLGPGDRRGGAGDRHRVRGRPRLAARLTRRAEAARRLPPRARAPPRPRRRPPALPRGRERGARRVARRHRDRRDRSAPRRPGPRRRGAPLPARERVRRARAAFAHADPERAEGVARLERALDAVARAPPVVAALELRRAAPAPCRPGWPAALEGVLPCGAQLVLPLSVRREALAVLALFAEDARQLSSPDHVALAEALARRIAIALENARLYRGAEDAVRARDRFLAVASHELKTPLTPLRIRISALERLVSRGALEDVPKEKLLELFSGAEGQVLRMARLVDDLLDVTRMSLKQLRLAPEPMDLRQSAIEVIERHRGRSPVRLRRPAGRARPGDRRLDRLRIEQVITNLLTNALEVRAAVGGRGPAEADEARARLVVRDAGLGSPRPTRTGSSGRSSGPRSTPPWAGSASASSSCARSRSARRLAHAAKRARRGSTFVVELPRRRPARREAAGRLSPRAQGSLARSAARIARVEGERLSV
jgi:Na+/proline symporter/signal transduction histidine kinase